MTTWTIKEFTKKPVLKDPILIEGLPGIGNVGKIALDYIADKIKPIKLYSFFSDSFPHSVFVDEDSIVKLPKIELYYKKFKNKKHDLLFLVGDIQPIDEQSCYSFCNMILNILTEFKGKEVITLGGIGLAEIPKKPKVYCTSNSKAALKKFKQGTTMHDKLFGIVGPIIGVSGLLVGLATQHKQKGISLLAETLGHPMYTGIKGAREIVKVLNSKYNLNINMKDINKEVEAFEKGILKHTEEMMQLPKDGGLSKISGKVKDTSYIG